MLFQKKTYACNHIKKFSYIYKTIRKNSSLDIRWPYFTGRRIVKLNLNTGFLQFVRRYINQDLKTSEIFGTIHEYFFSYKEMVRKIYETQIASNEVEIPYAIESGYGIFYSPKERQALLRGMISANEKQFLKEEVIKKEKIINAVRLFRQMLIENDLELFLINRKDDLSSSVMSSDLFTIREDYSEVLYNNFESYQNCDIRYYDDCLSQMVDIFFGVFKNQTEDYQIYRENEQIDAMFKLYLEHDAKKIIKEFPNEKDWVDPDGNGSPVAHEIKRRYMLPLTPIKTYIVPQLKDIRSKFMK